MTLGQAKGGTRMGIFSYLAKNINGLRGSCNHLKAASIILYERMLKNNGNGKRREENSSMKASFLHFLF